MDVPGAHVSYRFATDEMDISFGVFFQGLDGKMETVLPSQRVDSHYEPVSGDVAAWGEALAHAHEDDGAHGRMLGRSIGAWKIVGVVGHGGMGAVYAVERGDGAYAQRAALKLIRAGERSPPPP